MPDPTEPVEEQVPLAGFAKRVRDLRVERGLTLDELAERTGISRAYLWKLEKGRSSNPSPRISRKLSKFFDVKHSFLLGEENPYAQFDGDDGIVRLARALTPNQRRVVVDMMATLAQANGHDVRWL